MRCLNFPLDTKGIDVKLGQRNGFRVKDSNHPLHKMIVNYLCCTNKSVLRAPPCKSRRYAIYREPLFRTSAAVK